MCMPHPRGKASREETGCFMFFAWPVLLVIGLLQAFFWLTGWLFEQPWFYALLALGLIAIFIASCVAS